MFSCYTGLRISDIKRITWANISEDLLSYVPMKKKKQNETVTVPLTLEKKYLPDFVPGPHPIFNVFSDPVSNRYLKEIADEVSIKKSITYHTSRHTFGTLMAQTGHLPETQKMMGHGSIRTTMEYVHTSHDDIVKVKRQRFGLDT
ncbi:MAG: site-specific integrase [Bacteroidota bacterium]